MTALQVSLNISNEEQEIAGAPLISDMLVEQLMQNQKQYKEKEE